MIARQLRRASVLFLVLWVASFAVDAVAVFGSHHVRWSQLLWARSLPVPAMILIASRSYGRARVTVGRAQRLLLLSDLTTTLWLSLLALETGGLDSPYQTAVMFVPLSLATVPMPWRHGLLRHVMVTSTYVATMLVGHYVFGVGAAEKEHDEVSLFLVHFMMMHAMSISIMAISATLWSLRRAVFAAKNVGRYELRRILGRGGMGEVWAAYHTTLRREVALKLVRVDDASVADAAARFEREVEAMARLTHPNTVRIYDFGAEEGGLLYCAMELLEGEDLGAIVRREGPLPFARVQRLLLQAASALAEAHALGIVHRDIKPENLFVQRITSEQELLKVLDFGIAFVVGHADDRLTHRDAIAGTPAVMSPEVVHGATATPASDVYSLGCVAYYLLSGAMPFGTHRTAAVLNAQLHELPIPPSVRIAEPIPPMLESVVMRCLAKDPAERYRDAGELAAALTALEALSDAPRTSTLPPERPPEATDMNTLPGGRRLGR